MNIKNLFAVVVVWYNPEKQEVENILRYNNFFRTVYIVDNSSSDNKSLKVDIPNAVYLPQYENLGIGAALNKGCARAVSDGFEWCMTMDQDSEWDSEQLQLYLSQIEFHISEKNVSFAPSILSTTSKAEQIKVRLRKFARKIITRFLGEKAYLAAKKAVDGESKGHEVVRVITSGNVINLTTWAEIGKFNEALFIEQVDYEFCYRLKLAGYIITKFKNCYLNQMLGDGKQHLFELDKYHGVRLYYRYRNQIYMSRNYPQFEKNMPIIRDIFYKGITLHFKDMMFILQGVNAANKNKLGPYCR